MEGKAITLHDIANLKARQGDIEGAINSYKKCLRIFESINNARCKATTLNQLASLNFQQGHVDEALQMFYQAAQAFAEIHAYIDLCKILGNLGFIDERKGIIYLAQALWLCLKIQMPLVYTIDIFEVMYNTVPKGNEMQALLGTTAYYLCQVDNTEHPQLEDFQRRSFRILTDAAYAQEVKPELFEAWLVQLQLNNPKYFIPRLIERLDRIVGDDWLFERF